jgi:hypothetical protein
MDPKGKQETSSRCIKYFDALRFCYSPAITDMENLTTASLKTKRRQRLRRSSWHGRRPNHTYGLTGLLTNRASVLTIFLTQTKAAYFNL